MKVVKGILVAAVLLVIAAVVLVVALPGEKIAKLAADQVRAQTGRELVFEGDVGISWFPVLGVRTEAVRFSNADWSDNGPMFQADSAVIGVDVMAALSGNIRIKTVELVAPDVVLEVTADGRANWDLSSGVESDRDDAEASSSDTSGSINSITVERLLLTDARLRYFEAESLVQDIESLSVDLQWPDVTQAATLSVQAAPFGTEVVVEATVAAPEVLLQGGNTQVAVSIGAADGTAAFEGQLGLAPEVSGKLEVAAPEGDAFLSAFGAGGVEGPLSVSGDVTLTRDRQFSLRGGAIEALGNALTVQADVDLTGDRPKVAAQVATARLQLGGGDAEAAEASENTGGTGGWSKDPIDASALGLVDGTISFAAEAMNLSGIEVGKTRATVEIENARAVATINEMAVFEGTVQGTFIANNRDGLSVRGDMTAAQIGLQSFLSSTAGISRFTGSGDARGTFLSSGNSVDALMNAMSGEGNLSVGRGTIAGIDLDRLLRGDVTGGTTVFDNMAASWTITDGVLTNKDLVMGLPRLAATGAGTIGLGLQTINYLFTPQVRGKDGPALMVPVKISGSWSNPSIVPDLEAAIKSGFQADLNSIEDSVKEAVQGELGGLKEQGQSTEDAIKDKLENEAKKGILNLLGGN